MNMGRRFTVHSVSPKYPGIVREPLPRCKTSLVDVTKWKWGTLFQHPDQSHGVFQKHCDLKKRDTQPRNSERVVKTCKDLYVLKIGLKSIGNQAFNIAISLELLAVKSVLASFRVLINHLSRT